MRTPIRGPISRSESALYNCFGSFLSAKVGQCDQICSGCGALRWKLEGTQRSQSKTGSSLFSNCCQKGEVRLPEYYAEETPGYIKYLLTSEDRSEFVK